MKMIRTHSYTLTVIETTKEDYSENGILTAIETLAKTLGRRKLWVKKTLFFWQLTDENWSSFVEGVKAYHEQGETDWLVWGADSKQGENSLLLLKQELTDSFEPTTNPSKEWVKDQIKNHSLDKKLAFKLKNKWKMETIENLQSHANFWLWKWASIGQFDEYLAEHGSIKPSVLAAWLSGKMTRELFYRGKDALTRELTGSRTQQERSQGTEHPDSILLDVDAPEVAFEPLQQQGYSMTKSRVGSQVGANIHPYQAPFNPDTIDQPEDPRIGYLKDIIRLSRKKAYDRYIKIFDWMREGYSRDEIANLEGCSSIRAMHLTQKVRDTLKEGKVTTESAKAILKEISDEPFSTVKDLEGLELKQTSKAIEILEHRNLVEVNRNGCYTITTQGQEELSFGIFS